MIITSKRSVVRHVFEVILTVLSWGLLAYLLLTGIPRILKGAEQGPNAPFLPTELIASIHTLASYLLLMLMFAVVLVAWFKYNEHYGKYGKYGRYRRQGIPTISTDALRQSLGVTHSQFDHAQRAQVMLVHQDDEGAVVGIAVVAATGLATG